MPNLLDQPNRPGLPEQAAGQCQAQFHARWNHLNDPHVRTLAWLLDAPGLLDPNAGQWRGLIATLCVGGSRAVQAWLVALDRAPGLLHARLALSPQTRLGRYAEQLMAFYFEQQGILVAHGLQVRAGKNDTIGEFDFLLRQGQGGDQDQTLLHWEFATKFYLLAAGRGQQSGGQQSPGPQVDDFLGPNLADSLGAKMRKILNHQLILSAHPAAQASLPQAVSAAQALVKGWLFYHVDNPQARAATGISALHCRGFWCSLSEVSQLDAGKYSILPRLSWLAPAKVPLQAAVSKHQLQALLAAHFACDAMPLLITALHEQDGWMLESSRGFIVPDDWRSRAEQCRTLPKL